MIREFEADGNPWDGGAASLQGIRSGIRGFVGQRLWENKACT